LQNYVPPHESSYTFWIAPVSSVFRLVSALFIKLGMGISPSLQKSCLLLKVCCYFSMEIGITFLRSQQVAFSSVDCYPIRMCELAINSDGCLVLTLYGTTL